MAYISKKAQQRDHLSRDIDKFLSRGGVISSVDTGLSSLPRDGRMQTSAFAVKLNAGESQPPATRTPLNDVVAAIELRKQAKKNPVKSNTKPKKKWIYDDFGEPVRWVWE